MVRVKAKHRYDTNVKEGEYTIVDNHIVEFINNFVSRYTFNMSAYARDVLKTEDYLFRLIMGKDNVKMMLSVNDCIVDTSELEFDNFIIPKSLQCDIVGNIDIIKNRMEIFVLILEVNIIEETFVKITDVV